MTTTRTRPARGGPPVTDPTDAWHDRFVEQLLAAPAGKWPGVVRAAAADAPARLRDALRAAAALAAEFARDPARTAAERAAWGAVIDGLAAEYPAHAADLRGYSGLLGAVAAPAAAPVVERQLAAGDRLGPFTVTRFIAAGGMGAVYAAEQDGLARTVALKVIRDAAASPLDRARFDRERLVLAKLHQSNIVPVYHAGEQDGLQYYAMQYVAGAPLHRVVTAVYQRATTAPNTAPTPPLSEVADALFHTPPSPPVAPTDPTQKSDRPALAAPAAAPAKVRLSAGYFRSVAAAVAQVAEAIEHGHGLGIVHRDIKPSNLIVDARGGCWVIDYGLARAAGTAEAPAAGGDVLEDAVTRGWVGTPQYMAPEQFDGHADARSDVWSLGATLYDLLALRPAFAGKTLDEVRTKVLAATPPPISDSVTNVPRDLIEICRKALTKAAADRYESAAALAADLRRWLGGETTTVWPDWRTLRPLRLWAWRHKGAAAAVVLVLAGIVAGSIGSAAFAQQEANFKFAQERVKREAADELAEQRRKELDFVRVLGEAEELRRRRPFAGWSEAVQKKLDEARRLRPDAPLRDAYAATLTGPDARRVRLYEHPEGRGPVKAGFGSVAFGPDGRLVCGGFAATPGMVFDPNPARAPVPTTRLGTGPVAYPDADTPLQLMPPAKGDRGFVLWNLATNKAVAEFPLPPDAVGLLAMALSADGKRVALALARAPAKDSKQSALTIAWEVTPKADAPTKLKEWPAGATALAFTPDGKYLAAGTATGGVTVRAVNTGEVVADLRGERATVLALAFGRSPRVDATGTPPPAGGIPGLSLAAGHKSGTAVVWDLATKDRVNVIRGVSHYVNAVAFTPDGAALIAVGHNAPSIWDVGTGHPLFDLMPAPDAAGMGYLTGVAVSPDGRRVALVGTNQLGGKAALQVYEFDTARGVTVYHGLNGQCHRAWLSPSAALVAGLSDNWQLAVWERATGRLKWVWDVPEGITTDNSDAGFDEAAGAVYFASGTAAVRLDLATGARTQAWKLPHGFTDRFLVRPGHPPRLARVEPIGSGQVVVRCRDFLPDGTTRERFTLPPTNTVHRIRFHAEGKYVAVVHAKRDHLYDADTGRPVPLWEKLPDRFDSVERVAADGSRFTGLLAYPDDRRVMAEFRLADMARLPGEFEVPVGALEETGAVGVLRTLVPGKHGTAVYRRGSNEPVVTFDAGADPVNTPAITPDGRYAVWGREDGTVRVADLTRALEQLTALTGR